MRPIGPMSRALYRLTGVPKPLEHAGAVAELTRRAEREERRTPLPGRVRLIEIVPLRRPA